MPDVSELAALTPSGMRGMLNDALSIDSSTLPSRAPSWPAGAPGTRSRSRRACSGCETMSRDHGSRPPDKDGRSLPLFVNKKREAFQTSMGVAYLKQMQRHVAE